MTLTGLLRILFRRKTSALTVLALTFSAGLLTAAFWPLVYESQAILERKPSMVTPRNNTKDGEEFDVYRLTSESQRSVALLKSRYMLEKWYDTLELPAQTPLKKERGMADLKDDMIVQPVSYTDLFVVKVRAKTPEEAQHRAQVLIGLFSQWDITQGRQEATQLVSLLGGRLNQVTSELNSSRRRLQEQKAGLSINLSGSASTRQLEADIAARGSLFEQLTSELESAERQLSNDALPRTRILAAPSVPGKPVTSRKRMLALVFFLSPLLAMAWACVLEWLDPSIHRMGDIMKEAPNSSIITVPARDPGITKESVGTLDPLVNTIAQTVSSKGTAVVQVAPMSPTDPQTNLTAGLAEQLSGDFRVHRVESPAASLQEKPLSELKQANDVILIETKPSPGQTPGDTIVNQADLGFLVVEAGKTSRSALRSLIKQIALRPAQRFIFVLTGYKDPLPQWLRGS